MEMKAKKSSVRMDMISYFSVLMVFTMIVVGFVVFSSWKASSEEMIEMHEKDAHEDKTQHGLQKEASLKCSHRHPAWES